MFRILLASALFALIVIGADSATPGRRSSRRSARRSSTRSSGKAPSPMPAATQPTAAPTTTTGPTDDDDVECNLSTPWNKLKCLWQFVGPWILTKNYSTGVAERLAFKVSVNKNDFSLVTSNDNGYENARLGVPYKGDIETKKTKSDNDKDFVPLKFTVNAILDMEEPNRLSIKGTLESSDVRIPIDDFYVLEGGTNGRLILSANTDKGPMYLGTYRRPDRWVKLSQEPEVGKLISRGPNKPSQSKQSEQQRSGNPMHISTLIS